MKCPLSTASSARARVNVEQHDRRLGHRQCLGAMQKCRRCAASCVRSPAQAALRTRGCSRSIGLASCCADSEYVFGFRVISEPRHARRPRRSSAATSSGQLPLFVLDSTITPRILPHLLHGLTDLFIALDEVSRSMIIEQQFARPLTASGSSRRACSKSTIICGPRRHRSPVRTRSALRLSHSRAHVFPAATRDR